MRSRRRAISLIELTLVILVVGFLAAVAAPKFADSLRVMRCQAAARQLAAHVDYIRQVAINEGRSTSLVCDNNLHTYASTDVDSPQHVGRLLQVSLHRDYDPGLTLTANFDAQTTLSFDFEGVPRVGTTPLVQGTIELAAGDDKYVVIIASGTGKTSVRRVNGNSGASDVYDDASAQSTPGGST